MSRADYPDFSAVRAKVGGLKGVMTRLGDAPMGDRWNPMPACPFCGSPSAGVFDKGGVYFFKCHQQKGRKRQACPTGGDVLSETSYLAAREGLSDTKPASGGPSEAYKRLLEMAGLWVEKTPNVERGTEKTPNAERGTAKAENRTAKPASTRTGTSAPQAQTDSRPVTGAPGNPPVSTAGGRPPVSSPSIAMPEASSAGKPAGDDPEESSSAVACPSGLPHARPGEGEASLAMADGRRQMADGGKQREGKAVKRKKRAEEFIAPAGTFTIPGAAVREQHGVEVPPELRDQVAEAEAAVELHVEEEAGDEEKAGGGRAVITSDERAEVLKFLYAQLAATDEDLAKWDEDRALAPCVARACGLRSNRAENLPLLQALVPKFSVGACLAAGVWERRGGTEDGQLSNDAAERWARRFPPGFVPAAVEGCVPSRFFFGFGQIAQVRLVHAEGTPGRASQVESLKRDLSRRHEACGPLNFWEHDNKLVVSGFNGQPIIPYFDWLPAEEHVAGAAGGLDLGCITEGELKAIAWWSATAEGVRQMAAPRVEQLIALRTHKKWAKDSRAHCFTTRPAGGSIRFAGRTWRPGVAALPGITYGRKQGGTWVVRYELDEWLRLNGMTGALVVFDNEEKGDPDLPGYKDDVDRRFDSVLWGLALARDLGRERHAWFAMLPEDLRDAKGKVDWDGALVELRTAAETPDSERRTANAGARSAERGTRKGGGEEPAMPAAAVLDLGGEENPFHRDES